MNTFNKSTTVNDQMLNNMLEIMKNGTDAQKQEISNFFMQLNVQNRNQEKTKKFTKKILQKENQKKSSYAKFLESQSVNGMIWAPTQVGKSAATCEFIRTCFENNVPVIISTDNKTDQCDQLFERVKAGLVGADATVLRVSSSKFSKQLENSLNNKSNTNNRVAIFCLNNSSQIKKLIDSMKIVLFDNGLSNIKKIAIAHDEADTITKDKNTVIATTKQAESHKRWLELVDIFNKRAGFMDLKRIFITATPENVCMLYNIDTVDVIRLEIPESYVGYKSIMYKPMEDDLEIRDILKKEVARINTAKTYEIILYCIERKIVDGHEEALGSIITEIKCSASTYNGKGITVVFNSKAKSAAFEQILVQNKVAYKKDSAYIVIKNLAIKKFYKYCKEAGENCMITVGKDLIARGISYVGEDEIEPLTATTMVYKPGMTMHGVGICQTIGRITGCAMPKLQRRLYAPRNVIDTYVSYNKNQEKYINEITTRDNVKLTKDVIANMVFDRIPRDIDRKKLGLKMNYASETDSDGSNTAYEGDYYDSDKMKRLVGSWAKTTNKTQIATLFRDMVANGGFLSNTVITSDENLSNINRALGNKIHKNGWSLVFSKDSKNHTITPEAMEFYNSL